MVRDRETFKQALRGILELNFIENKSSIEKEMNMLNFLLTSFDKDAAYSYDDFCKYRMLHEIGACDTILDDDFNVAEDLSAQENNLVQSRIAKKSYHNPESDINDIMKDEYAQYQAEKICSFEKKVYYQIFKYSGEKLVEHKLGSIYKNNKDYFDNICDGRARKFSNEIAEGNFELYIEQIKSNLI